MHNLSHADYGYAYVTQRFLLKRFVLAFKAELALSPCLGGPVVGEGFHLV
jgi:hypothetical protein